MQLGRRGAIWSIMALLLAPIGARAEAAADLVVIGKTVNYRQSADGKLALLNRHFFAEIFTAPATVSEARLVTPAGRLLPFVPGDGLLKIGGDDYRDRGEMDAAFPDGIYQVRFAKRDGQAIEQKIAMNVAPVHLATPMPVRITLTQDGVPVAADRVQPGRDLVLGWSRFAGGRADPHGIVGDLIFAVLGDCHGKILFHSGGPFSAGGFLTFADRSVRIAGDKLHPGQRYQVSVEHAALRSTGARTVPAAATYATSSFLDFATTGAGVDSCDGQVRRMDDGQTDRPGRATP